MDVTTPIARRAAFERLALLDMGLEIADMAAAFGRGARPAGKPDVAQRIAHGSAAVAIARGIDVILGHGADIGPEPRKEPKCPSSSHQDRDLDGAVDTRIGIDDAGGFERVDDPSGPSSQPA